MGLFGLNPAVGPGLRRARCTRPAPPWADLGMCLRHDRAKTRGAPLPTATASFDNRRGPQRCRGNLKRFTGRWAGTLYATVTARHSFRTAVVSNRLTRSGAWRRDCGEEREGARRRGGAEDELLAVGKGAGGNGATDERRMKHGLGIRGMATKEESAVGTAALRAGGRRVEQPRRRAVAPRLGSTQLDDPPSYPR